jgi:hypothetical protein
VTITVSPAPAPTVTLAANPVGVTTGGSSTLTWSSTNATGCTAGGAWSGTKALSGSHVLSGLAETSSYTLTCTGLGGSEGKSVTITVSAPEGLTLTWTDNSGGTAGVYIERRDGTTQPYARIAQQEPGISSYLDTAVIAGLTYCYRVQAFDDVSVSGYSNEACGTP